MVHTNLTDFTHGWGKQQDFCQTGSLYDEYGAFNYMIIADGHGKGDIVSVLKNDDFPWRDVLLQTTSTLIGQTIINYLIYYGVLNKSTYDGTTISIAKIYSSFIHLVWLGDSKIQVFIDKNSNFLTPPHNCSNENEVDSFNTCGCYLKDTWDFKQTDSKKLVKVKTKRVVIDNNENTALTRCLGHNRILNEEFQEQFIDFTQNNKVDLVAATDGFWDVAGIPKDYPNMVAENTTARDLCKLAVKRWKQSWMYYPENERPYTQTFPRASYDDIAVAVWHN